MQYRWTKKERSFESKAAFETEEYILTDTLTNKPMTRMPALCTVEMSFVFCHRHRVSVHIFS